MGKQCYYSKKWLRASTQRAELCCAGLPQYLDGISGNHVQSWHRKTISFHSIFLLLPHQRKSSIIEALISPQQHWPREAKGSEFPWYELKAAWQVYRACVNLTSEQEYLLPGGASPFRFIFSLPTPESWSYLWKIHAAGCFKRIHKGSSTFADLNKPWWLIWKTVLVKCSLPEKKMSAQNLLKTYLLNKRMSKVIFYQIHRRVTWYSPPPLSSLST